MKKVKLFIIFMLLFASCTIIIVDSDMIQMFNEVIEAELYEGYANVNVDITFLSDYLYDVNLDCIFPVDDYKAYSDITGYINHPIVDDFEVISDNNPIESSKKELSYQHPLDGNFYKAYWYSYCELYKSKVEHKTLISYRVDLVPSTIIANNELLNQYDHICLYIIHTGKFWKDKIETMTVKVVNKESKEISGKMWYLGNFYNIDANDETFVFNNVEPDEDIFIFYKYD